MMKTESVLDNVHRPEMEEKVESIPLPSTVLTMFDKTKEQEVGLQNSLYLGANSIPIKKERISAHNNRVKLNVYETHHRKLHISIKLLFKCILKIIEIN